MAVLHRFYFTNLCVFKTNIFFTSVNGGIVLFIRKELVYVTIRLLFNHGNIKNYLICHLSYFISGVVVFYEKAICFRTQYLLSGLQCLQFLLIKLVVRYLSHISPGLLNPGPRL